MLPCRMRAKHQIHTSSKSSEWETPPSIFKLWDEQYHFTIDVCATPENTLLSRFWTITDNALSKNWKHEICWMNPPYGREIGKFMQKAYQESLMGAVVVCLVPSRTDTRWWHEYAMKGRIVYIRGRLKFINRTFPSWRSDGNFKVSPCGFPSAIVIFDSL